LTAFYQNSSLKLKLFREKPSVCPKSVLRCVADLKKYFLFYQKQDGEVKIRVKKVVVHPKYSGSRLI